jgi:tRNA (cytidine/uridine-2'-O-)-methyltransferase
MFRLSVVLHEPAIPQNAGNIARTCAAVGAELHLIKPLGFFLGSRQLKRAGLDYWPLVGVTVHADFDAFLASRPGAELYFFTRKAKAFYHDVRYEGDVCLVFGNENSGLPDSLLECFPDRAFRLPMKDGVRSLNVSNAAAAVVYEALRQNGFPGF